MTLFKKYVNESNNQNRKQKDGSQGLEEKQLMFSGFRVGFSQALIHDMKTLNTTVYEKWL